MLDASLSRIKGHITQLACSQASKPAAGKDASSAAPGSQPDGGAQDAGKQSKAGQDGEGPAVEALKKELEHANSSVSSLVLVEQKLHLALRLHPAHATWASCQLARSAS